MEGLLCFSSSTARFQESGGSLLPIEREKGKDGSYVSAVLREEAMSASSPAQDSPLLGRLSTPHSHLNRQKETRVEMREWIGREPGEGSLRQCVTLWASLLFTREEREGLWNFPPTVTTGPGIFTLSSNR
jgi:hypothetical protein